MFDGNSRRVTSVTFAPLGITLPLCLSATSLQYSVHFHTCAGFIYRTLSRFRCFYTMERYYRTLPCLKKRERSSQGWMWIQVGGLVRVCVCVCVCLGSGSVLVDGWLCGFVVGALVGVGWWGEHRCYFMVLFYDCESKTNLT